MASVAPERPHAVQLPKAECDSSGALSRLLASSARLGPDRVALRDGPGREAWCGRPSFELSCEIGVEAVSRLSGYLAALGLDPAARVGICLPNGSEAVMSILAVGEAGLTPCLLDVTATAGELSNAIEAADIRAIITQARLGSERIAEKLCFVAAGFFRLRFLLAFGPHVPDGVVDLDPVLLEPRSSAMRLARHDGTDEVGPGLVSFARNSGGRIACFRTYPSLLAAAAPIVLAANVRPGERLLSFIPPDDVKGLATGLAVGLLGRAVVEAHAVFDSAIFADSLAEAAPTHLVAPGWMEPALAELIPAAGWLSTILVHEPPLSFEGRPGVPTPIIDVVCCSELALLTAARREPGRISFADLCAASDFGTGRLIEVRVESDGDIALRGPAVAGPDRVRVEPDSWQHPGLRIERSRSAITGIA